MKGGAHSFPFAALSFPNSKKLSIFCWVDRESFPVAAWRSRASNSRFYGDFLHRSRAKKGHSGIVIKAVILCCACSRCGIGVVFSFFCVWGGGGIFGFLYLRSIYSFPLFFSFSFLLFLTNVSILDGNSQRAIESKTANQRDI